MRKTLATLAALGATLAAGAAHATDVGVSVQISQPGVYGRVDIGRFPQPAVVVQQPVVIAQPAVVVAQPQPVYMWVPPGHRKHWHKHCYRYNACGTPVYFVQDRWYRQHVAPVPVRHAPPPPRPMPPHMAPEPRYEPHGRGEGRGHGRGKGHGHDHD
jgi:hypothetical protein